MQQFRGIVIGFLVGVPVAVFVYLWLKGTPEASIAIASAVGIAVALVVGTETNAHDIAGDAAWREAAPDLPPASDRRALEVRQEHMPGPEASPAGAAKPVSDEDAGFEPEGL